MKKTKKKSKPYDIADAKLAKEGIARIEWAGRDMPVLEIIRKRFRKEKPLRGKRLAACLHVTSETANLMITLKEGGAAVSLCASNPQSTQDDVAAALALKYKIPTYAVCNEGSKSYYEHIHAVLDTKPHFTMDDGADLVATLHRDRRELLDGILAGTEETTTGVIRLQAMAKDGKLEYPILAVNDANTKHFFDNRYGTGQSTLDGIIRATNRLLAGQVFVVSGYGWCGKGLANRARGLGARVVVTEVDSLPALEAHMDGFDVMPMDKAAVIGDYFVTVTGCRDVIRKEHFLKMKDGAVVSNSGHFNVELDLESLKKASKKIRTLKPHVEEYTLRKGTKVLVLAQGRLVNLAAAEGHPAAVMDMSFANQALGAEYLSESGNSLTNDVHPVPRDIDDLIAKLKLAASGVKIDTLTPRQVKYLASWEEGT